MVRWISLFFLEHPRPLPVFFGFQLKCLYIRDFPQEIR